MKKTFKHFDEWGQGAINYLTMGGEAYYINQQLYVMGTGEMIKCHNTN